MTPPQRRERSKAQASINAILSGVSEIAKIAKRFWAKVNKNGPIPEYAPELGQCWLWTDSPSHYGYGKFRLLGATVGAHRVALALSGEQFPKGLIPDHLCRVRLCVRPSHLAFKTHRENILCGKGLAAKNAKKKYCKRGHPLFGKNLSIQAGPRRCCKRCGRDKMRQRRANG